MRPDYVHGDENTLHVCREAGVPVEDKSVPRWAFLALGISGDTLIEAINDEATRTALIERDDRQEATMQKARSGKHRSLPHKEHAALLLAALPRHAYLVLRALAHIIDRREPPLLRACKFVVLQFAHPGILPQRKSWRERGPDVAALKQAAQRYKDRAR